MARKLLVSCALFAAAVAAATPWPKQSYQTESFVIPEFKVVRQGQSANPGSFFVGIINAATPALRGPFIAEDTGELVWRGPSEFNSYYNFQSQTIDNKPVLTYWTGFLDFTGHGYGSVTVLDDTYTPTKTICFPESVTIVPPRPAEYPGATPSPCYVDKHESFITDRNSILVTAYNATQTDLTALNGPADGWVFDCLVFELDLDTNEVRFQWSALDHVPVTKSKFRGKNDANPLFINGKQFGNSRSQPWDYFHINSIDPVPGGYIINSRMTWSFYLIDAQTKDITWTLEGSHGGDFQLLDPIFFSWQHKPRLQATNGNVWQIHLFNNDNIPGVANGANKSNSYLLDVNTQAMTVSINQLYQNNQNPPVYAAAEGGVQDFSNGHHLVGYGQKPFIEEWDENANLIYRAQFARPIEKTHAYRVYRQAWDGFPTTPPKVVASVVQEGGKQRVKAYMSWNGATTVSSWNLHAGHKKSMLRLVAAKVAKKGFESTVTVDDGRLGFRYVRVEALDANGKSLAKSTIQTVSGSQRAGLSGLLSDTIGR